MPPRRRPKKGGGRIDAAIDHFTPMGYAKPDIRAVVKQLLKLYGDDGWPFLEEGAYRVVQEALFEKQEREEQLQLQQQLEAAMDEAPSEMPIVEVHDETDPVVEAILPVPEATVTSDTRRPCYGWLIEYESESDYEEDACSRSCDMKPFNW
uniref:WIYLD domain-containing protein n=1 Tax=Oryza brachyantha TaxID=4533 RepID=J3MVL2_ORYBR